MLLPVDAITAPCGLRLRALTAYLDQSDGCGIVSQSFRSSARALRPEGRRQISRDNRDRGRGLRGLYLVSALATREHPVLGQGGGEQRIPQQGTPVVAARKGRRLPFAAVPN